MRQVLLILLDVVIGLVLAGILVPLTLRVLPDALHGGGIVVVVIILSILIVSIVRRFAIATNAGGVQGNR